MSGIFFVMVPWYKPCGESSDSMCAVSQATQICQLNIESAMLRQACMCRHSRRLCSCGQLSGSRQRGQYSLWGPRMRYRLWGSACNRSWGLAVPWASFARLPGVLVCQVYSILLYPELILSIYFSVCSCSVKAVLEALRLHVVADVLARACP